MECYVLVLLFKKGKEFTILTVNEIEIKFGSICKVNGHSNSKVCVRGKVTLSFLNSSFIRFIDPTHVVVFSSAVYLGLGSVEFAAVGS